MKTRRYLYIIISLIILILFSYWLKCQLRINLFNFSSVSPYVPFKYLTKNNVKTMKISKKTGVLINESFDRSIWKLNYRPTLWMAEKGKVTQAYDNNGINNSRALLIKSKSSKSWSYSYNMLIEVKPGDNFSFEGLVKIEGDTAIACLGVASFDKNNQVIKWNYVSKKTYVRNKWTKVSDHFTVSDGIAYIKFRHMGSGIGEFRFDNIKLIKEPPIASQGEKKE